MDIIGRIEFKIKFDQYPALSLSYHFVWQENCLISKECKQ